MKYLYQYGWNNHYETAYSIYRNNEFEIGRVISIKGFINTLITDAGELEAELSGKLLYGVDLEELPKVGDWVEFIRYDTIGYIIRVLPRINALSRKNPGNPSFKQVMAANIDFALIVQGLDRNFNIMRMERYIVQILACGIQPVIILNKADLIDDPGYFLNEVKKLGRDCPVYFCSTYTQTGITEIENAVLQTNKTHILIGSSGAGKSSLLNAFLDHADCLTGAISDSTGKGRHITTSRELFLLPNGSLIIDSPGMREFGIAIESNEHISGLFPLIDNFAGKCRYTDCQHLEETGCAVIEAYTSGLLEPKVYESYLKLIREQKHYEIKLEDKKRLGKKFGKMIREVREYRKKYKY